jgi:putative Ca2+/H+ antiporter (TMEM165/GDT1 family)
MDLRSLIIVFWSVFIAEIGDKTQLATMMFSAEGRNPYIVFLGSSLALVLAAGIGVVAGNWLSDRIHPVYLKIVAGVGFILIGIWTLFSR